MNLVPYRPSLAIHWPGNGRLIDHMQLGTADWLPDRGLPLKQFQNGDLWLGRARNGDFVGMRDDRHVFVCCGTRGGKGTSFLIPNLCLWPGSAVVVDPKGENAVVTARRPAGGSQWSQGMGKKVHILDPFGEVKTSEDDFSDLKASFNPMDAIRADDPESIDAAFRIAEGMVVAEEAKDPFWPEAAIELIGNLIFHVATAPAFAPHERNLLSVRKLLTAGDAQAAALAAAARPGRPVPTGFDLLLAAMKRNPAFGGGVARAGTYFAEMESKLLGSIAQTARTNTRFLESPGMNILLKSSFRLSDLKTNPRGETVYLCLPQRYMDSHFRWLRMMTTLITTDMERIRRQPACGSPVLMVLDEFSALRRMRTLETAAAQLPGYGVKMMFVSQTLPQLKDIYKDNWETFIANAGVKVFFCNDDHFTRDYVSKLMGEREIVRRLETFSETRGISNSQTTGGSTTRSSGSSYSTGGDRGSFGWNDSKSSSSSYSQTFGTNASQTGGYTTSIHKRLLLNPDEVGRLFGNRGDPKAIVLISGYHPAALERVHYHRERSFESLYDWHPDHPKPLTISQIAERIRKEREKLAEAEEEQFATLDEVLASLKKAGAEADRKRQIELERQRQYNRGLAMLFLLSLVGISTAIFILVSLLYILNDGIGDWVEASVNCGLKP